MLIFFFIIFVDLDISNPRSSAALTQITKDYIGSDR